MRIKEGEARAVQQIGAHETGEEPGLAGAGLADRIEVAAPVGWQQRHALAGREGAKNGVAVRMHGPANVPYRGFVPLVRSSVGATSQPLHARACEELPDIL